MASETFTIVNVSGPVAGPWQLLVNDSSAVSLGDHVGAAFGTADGDSGVWRVTDLPGANLIEVTDDIGLIFGPYGAPIAGDGWFDTPTTRYLLSNPPFEATHWQGAHRRNRYILETQTLKASENLADLADAAVARANLGIAIGVNVQAHSDRLDEIAGIPPTADHMIAGTGSAWEGRTPAAVRSGLGLVIGTDVQAHSTQLDTLASLTPTADQFVGGTGSALAMRTPSQVRSSLSLVVGTDVQAQNDRLQELSGVTPSADQFVGGTGAALAMRTAAQVRTSLGLVIGTDVQAQNDRLQELSGITPVLDNFLMTSASAVVLRTPGQAQTALGLQIGVNVQAYDVRLDELSAFTPAKGDVYTGNAANQYAQLPVGADGNQLIADSTQPLGLRWAPPGGTTQAVPVGTIISWWRALQATPVPNSWQICDGAAVTDAASPFFGQNTPNLQDRFIRGLNNASLPTYGGDIGPPPVGGADSHGHSTNSAGDHSHTVNSHNHSIATQANHSHTISLGSGAGNFSVDLISGRAPDGAGQHDHTGTTGNSAPGTNNAGSHSHSVNGSSNVPAYTGLLQIIKIK